MRSMGVKGIEDDDLVLKEKKPMQTDRPIERMDKTNVKPVVASHFSSEGEFPEAGEILNGSQSQLTV